MWNSDMLLCFKVSNTIFMKPQETALERLKQNVLAILFPLRTEWEEAVPLMEAVENGSFSVEKLTALADVLIRATESVTNRERVENLSFASEFIQRNRKREYAERLVEQSENEALIHSL